MIPIDYQKGILTHTTTHSPSWNKGVGSKKSTQIKDFEEYQYIPIVIEGGTSAPNSKP